MVISYGEKSFGAMVREGFAYSALPLGLISVLDSFADRLSHCPFTINHVPVAITRSTLPPVFMLWKRNDPDPMDPLAARRRELAEKETPPRRGTNVAIGGAVTSIRRPATG